MTSRENVFEPTLPSSCDGEPLDVIGAALVALHVLSTSQVDDTTLAHEPVDSIAKAISEVEMLGGRNVLFCLLRSKQKEKAQTRSLFILQLKFVVYVA